MISLLRGTAPSNRLDAVLQERLRADGRGALEKRVCARTGLREGNDVPDSRRPTEHRHQPIEACPDRHEGTRRNTKGHEGK